MQLAIHDVSAEVDLESSDPCLFLLEYSKPQSI